MKIISPETARISIGEPEGEDLALLFDTAVKLATAPLENVLGTSFQRADVADVFHVVPGATSAVSQFPTQLKLSRGFLDASLPVSLKTETILDGVFQDPEDYVGDYKIDYIKGALTVPAILNGWYSVSYTAGFEVDPTCGNVTTTLPDWLEAATLTLVTSIYQKLNSRHATSGLDEKSQKISQAAVTQLPEGFAADIRPYIRWFPTAYSVEWSS